MITAIDDEEIESAEDLTGTLTDLDPGSTVTVTVIRDDETVEESVELGQRPGGIPAPE